MRQVAECQCFPGTLKPLWYHRVEKLKELRNDGKAVREFLDETERMLTEPIDFRESMEYTG